MHELDVQNDKSHVVELWQLAVSTDIAIDIHADAWTLIKEVMRGSQTSLIWWPFLLFHAYATTDLSSRDCQNAIDTPREDISCPLPKPLQCR